MELYFSYFSRKSPRQKCYIFSIHNGWDTQMIDKSLWIFNGVGRTGFSPQAFGRRRRRTRPNWTRPSASAATYCSSFLWKRAASSAASRASRSSRAATLAPSSGSSRPACHRAPSAASSALTGSPSEETSLFFNHFSAVMGCVSVKRVWSVVGIPCYKIFLGIRNEMIVYCGAVVN